jgi:hypothetical protein
MLQPSATVSGKIAKNARVMIPPSSLGVIGRFGIISRHFERQTASNPMLDDAFMFGDISDSRFFWDRCPFFRGDGSHFGAPSITFSG